MKQPPVPRTVALTGATGFVGARILDHLTGVCGHEIRALTRRPQPARRGVKWISGALDDDKSLSRLADGADALVHVAGLIKARTRDQFNEVNIEGTRRVARAISNAGSKNGARLVLISSLAAHEPHLSHYAASKRGAEDAAAEIMNDGALTVLRPSAVYGPGDVEILKLLRVMKRGFAPTPGSRNNRFSLIHADDVARAVEAVLWRSETHARTFEIDDGNPNGYAMEDVAAIVGRALGKRVKTLPLPRPLLRSLGGLNEFVALATRASPMLTRGKARELTHPDWTVSGPKLADLGIWSPEIPALSGLPGTIEWYKAKGLL